MTTQPTKEAMEKAGELFDLFGCCRRNDSDDHVCSDGHEVKCQEHWFSEEDFVLHLALALDAVREEERALIMADLDGWCHDFMCNVGVHNIHTELTSRGCNCGLIIFVERLEREIRQRGRKV